MAKFCGKCGAQCDDAARVCGICGAALETDANPNINANVNAGGNAFAEKGAAALSGIKGLIQKPAVKIGAIAAAALVVVLILIAIIPGLFPPKSLENKMLKAIKKGDEELIVSILSSDENEKEQKEYYKSQFKSMNKYFEDAVGEDYKLKVEIIDTYDISAKDYDKYNSDRDGYKDVDWQKKHTGVLKFTVKGSKKSITVYGTFSMYKEDGKWSLSYVDLPG